MTKVLGAAILGLLLTAGAVHSQTIRGTVVEDGSDAPIGGAMVEIVGLDSGRTLTAETDSLGRFHLAPGRAGRYVLRLRHVAFRPVDEMTLNAGPGEALEVRLRMGRAVIPIEPLVVTTRRRTRLTEFHERRERNAVGRFITRDDIEERPGSRTTDLLRMMPGVQLIPASSMGADNLIVMRGGAGRCLATVYIDGVPFPQIAEAGVDAMLTPDALEGVEVYSGGANAPATMHSRNGCGVVAFWTRAHVPDGRRWSWKRAAAAVGAFSALIFLTH